MQNRLDRPSRTARRLAAATLAASMLVASGQAQEARLVQGRPTDAATLGASLSGEWTGLPCEAVRFEVVPEGLVFDASLRLDGKVQGFVDLGKKGFDRWFPP